MKLRKVLRIVCPAVLITILVIGGVVIYRQNHNSLAESPYARIEQSVAESVQYDEIMVAGADADNLYYNVTIHSDGSFEGSLSYSASDKKSADGLDNVAVSGKFDDFDSMKSIIDELLNDSREAIRETETGAYLMVTDATTSEHSNGFKAFLSNLNCPVK